MTHTQTLSNASEKMALVWDTFQEKFQKFAATSYGAVEKSVET